MLDIRTLVSKRPLLSVAVALTLTLLFIYRPLNSFDFLAIDDGMHTEINPHISPLTWENISYFWSNPYENAYTPITYSVWALGAVFAHNSAEQKEASRSYLNPLGNRFHAGTFHWLNLIFHIATALCLYVFLSELIKVRFAAFVGTLFFALHPLQVETVCWITGLRDVMAGFFSVAFLVCYLRYCRLRNDESWLPFDSEVFTRLNGWYVLCSLTFIAATLCKSSSLVIPGIAVILSLTILKRPFFHVILETLPWFILVLPLVKLFSLLNSGVAERVVYIAPLGMRFFIALDAIAFYLGKLFWPATLIMDYGRPPQYVLQQTAFYWYASIPLLLSGILAFFSSHRWGLWALTAFLVFVAGLVPILGINPFIFQHISTVADRYVYLSLLGPAILVCWLYASFRKYKATVIVSFVLLTGLGLKSLSQVWIWENNLTIFDYTLRHTPQSWLATNNLGTVFENMKDWQTAKTLYLRAAEISSIPSAWNNYAAMAMQLNQHEEAIVGFQRALEMTGASWAHANLGSALAKVGRVAEAREHLRTAIQMDQRMQFVNANLKLLETVGKNADFKITRSDKDLQNPS